MSENKFIAKLKGEPTPKSVVEIQNDRLVAPFKSSPMGHIADRDSSVVAAKGAQNWAVNQEQLVPVADDYIGTESNLTTTSRVSGAGLWLNATYTFPATDDEKNPVSAIIAPSAKWVLTLCGDSLMTQNGSVITLTMLIKIGATHLTTKQFKVRECASQFSQRMAIDFSESEQKVIKAHGGSPLTVQVLCDDEGASATIYSGMTHLTLLQRKIDADLVSTDNVLLPEFIENLLEGYIIPADYFSRYEYLEQVREDEDAIPRFTRNGDEMTFTGWSKGVLYKAGENITISDDNVISSTAQESFFRGTWKNWNSVSTNPEAYAVDYHGNKTPKENDYIVVQDTSDYKPGYNRPITVKVVNTAWGQTAWTLSIDGGESFTVPRSGSVIEKDYQGFKLVFTSTYNDVYVSTTVDTVYESNLVVAGETMFIIPVRAETGTEYVSYWGGSDFEYQGSWRFSYHGVWETDNKNGWVAEYQIEETLPIATETQAGINRTYTAGANISIVDNVISSNVQESFFRGRFTDWADVPTIAQMYNLDFNNNRKPTNNDYIVVEDASGFTPGLNIELEISQTGTRVFTIEGIEKQAPVAPDSVSWELDDITITASFGVGGDGLRTYFTANKTVLCDGVVYAPGEYFAKIQYYSDPGRNIYYSNSESLSGSWRFVYRGVWDTDSTSGWKPEYQIEEVMPIASDTQAGIAKLYTTTGSNEDGAMTQKAITENTTRVIIRRWN